MNTIYLSVQGLLYIPFIAFILLLIHLRDKAYWVDNILTKIDERFNSANQKLGIYVITISLAFLYGIIISAIVFPVSDVDEAMVGAIRSFFIDGKNPYIFDVVPHILYLPQGTEIKYGTYNYGPVDLVIYGIGYFLFHQFVGPSWWIFVTNIILTTIIYLFIRQLSPTPETVKLLSFLFLFSWFLQDNAVLMCLFLAIAWFIHYKVESEKKYPLVVIVLTLGVLTKLYVAFVLLAYFVYIFKKDVRLWITNGILGAVIAIIVSIPFSVIDVVKSILLFHVDLNIREGYATIQGGIPTYLELFGLNILFIPIAVVLVILFLYLSEKYAHNQLNLKLAVFTTICLVLLPSSGYSFFIIPSFFLLAQYYQNYISNHNLTESMS